MNQASAGYQVLVLLCQAAVFVGLTVWALRCTRPGRDVAKALVAIITWWPRRQRAARARAAMDRWNGWVNQLAYWTRERGNHDPGTRGYELAQDSINALHRIRPPHPGPCPFDGFTCTDPTCMVHPRSRQS